MNEDQVVDTPVVPSLPHATPKEAKVKKAAPKPKVAKKAVKPAKPAKKKVKADLVKDNKVLFTFRVADTTLVDLNAIAAKREVTPAALIRMALATFINDAKRRGRV